MPDNAPTKKLEAAKEVVTNQGYTLIPPFDHLDVIAGQGTAVMEPAHHRWGI